MRIYIISLLFLLFRCVLTDAQICGMANHFRVIPLPSIYEMNYLDKILDSLEPGKVENFTGKMLPDSSAALNPLKNDSTRANKLAPSDVSTNDSTKNKSSKSDVAPPPVDPEGKKQVMRPNPIRNHELLYVDLGENFRNWNISIFSYDGRLIQTQIANPNNNTISTNGLKPGVYLLRANTDTEMHCGKFVVE